jgi:hypothetical protein
VLAFAFPSAAAAGTTATEQIAALNAQREANGIPGGIVEQPQWTEGCRKHMAYIAANGGVLTHEEDPDKPGYTPEGASAGLHSVLAPDPVAFGPGGNAFETAPLHLMQTLAPALAQMGVSAGCATTTPGYDRPATRPSLFTYPGDGSGGVARSETASEMPFVPGDFAGLPQGTTTGIHLLVMSLGTGTGRLTSATLSGPDGPLEVRTVDNATPQLVGYMPPGGIIIPLKPLAVDATYTASATFHPDDGAPLSRTWQFSTGAFAAGAAVPAVADAVEPDAAAAAAPAPAPLRLETLRPSSRSVPFALRVDRALVGRQARVSIQRLVRTCSGAICRNQPVGRRTVSYIGRLASRQTIRAPRPSSGRAIRVSVLTQAYVVGGVTYPRVETTARWSP